MTEVASRKQQYCVAFPLGFLLLGDHLVEDGFVSKHMLFFVLLAYVHRVDAFDSGVGKLLFS